MISQHTKLFFTFLTMAKCAPIWFKYQNNVFNLSYSRRKIKIMLIRMKLRVFAF